MRVAFGPFYPGRFTGHGPEVVVAMSGCESGASTAQTYGARALVRKTAHGWHRMYYAPGALGHCTALVPQRGRSRLLCRVTGGHMCAYFDALELHAFRDSGKTVQEKTATLLSVGSNNLGGSNPPCASDPVVLNRIARYRFRATARRATGRRRARGLVVDVVSSVRCPRTPHACTGTGRVRRFTLHYTFDGRVFRLAPDSRAALAALQTRAPGP